MRNSLLKYEIPTTVDEVAELIIEDLPLRERAEFARMELEDLGEINNSLRPYILEEFKIFTGNFILFDDCMNYAENKKLENQEPSMAVIYYIWQKLKKSYRLRLVK